MPKFRTNSPLREIHWIAWGWLLPFVLITRPFRGIFHDGYLYAAQALQRLDPSALESDMFFAYGNQDSFTAFSYLYAPLIKAMGLFEATYALWAAGLIFWTCAMVFLARTVMPTPRDALISTACVICLHSGYGNMQLAYGEAWVTPRIWAEALCMIAIASALQRRFVALGIACLLALLLHPLIALSGVALAFWMLSGQKRTFFLTLGAALALGLTAAAIGLGPFSWLFEQIDAAWWDVIQQYSQIVLVGAWWHIAVFIWLPLPLVSLWLVWRNGTDQHRDLISGILVIGAGFTLLSFLFTDMLNNRLFTALQLWRAEIWIALFGNLFAWYAYFSLPQAAQSRHVFGAALVLTAVPSILGVPSISGALLALSAAVFYLCEQRNVRRFLKLYRTAAVILMLTSILSLPAMGLAMFNQSGSAGLFWQAIALLIAVVGLWSILKIDYRLRGLGLIFCLPLAVIASDKRSDREVFLATQNAIPQVFADRLHGKTVYWEDELALVWFGLNMPNYYSCRHLSGVVFHRSQALEVTRRAAALSVLQPYEIIGSDRANCPHAALDGIESAPDVSPLRVVCSALPDLDFIVLKQLLNSKPVATWISPFSKDMHQRLPVLFRSRTREETTTYYLYPCAEPP